MKAILISLMIIAVVGGMVGSGLFAYFSDTETSNANTFQAGSINITAGTGVVEYTPGVGDLKPCSPATLTITVTNVGLNPCDLYKQIDLTAGSHAGLAGVTNFYWNNTDTTPAGTVAAVAADTTWHLVKANVAPNEVVTLVQKVHIPAEYSDDADDPNTVQGKSFGIIDVFKAVQIGQTP